MANSVELGRGAMGVTYRAIDTSLQRPVALKVISSRLIDNEVLKSRFIREARAAASLRHPNVASVFYLGSTESSLLLRDGAGDRGNTGTIHCQTGPA